MFGFSFTEIIFLAVLALIVIGPKQLPEVARTIGRFLNDLKRSSEGLKEEFKIKIEEDFDLRRNQASEDLKKQQEKMRRNELAQKLPIAEEDRQLSLDGFDKKEKN